MFEELGPTDLPLPPAGALEQAMSRGRTIRRQRRVWTVTGVALGAALIVGVVLINPLPTNRAIVVPAAPHPVTTPGYPPIPTSPALSAQADSLDFGILTSITTSNGVVTLHLNRAHFYMGAAAKAHDNGQTPLDGFVFDDTDGEKEYTFTLEPNASIQAEAQLTKGGEGGNDTRETLTQEQLISRMKKIESTNTGGPGLMVWLRHTDGLTGPVTALVDQFIT